MFVHLWSLMLNKVYPCHVLSLFIIKHYSQEISTPTSISAELLFDFQLRSYLNFFYFKFCNQLREFH